MDSEDVFRLLLARRDNYGVTEIEPMGGRLYLLKIHGKRYCAVILPNSFDFYEKRYHLAKYVPDLVVCFSHDTALAVPCLSLRAGCIAEPYDLPAQIDNVEQQRHRSKFASQVLLGIYLCGMQYAQKLV